jgi:hypothetical protein
MLSSRLIAPRGDYRLEHGLVGAYRFVDDKRHRDLVNRAVRAEDEGATWEPEARRNQVDERVDAASCQLAARLSCPAACSSPGTSAAVVVACSTIAPGHRTKPLLLMNRT